MPYIVQALAETSNPNNEARQAAEAALKTAKQTPGYASALLGISADPSVNQYVDATGASRTHSLDITHAAAIQFGQLVEVHWKFKDKAHAERVATSGFEYVLLDEADKQQVRENIMKAVNA
jgi:hypothetical protein